MNSSLSASTKVVLPEGWRTSAFAQLSAHENVLAWLEVDLNAQLHFSLGLLIVTDQRVLFAAQEVGSSPVWDSWPLVAGMKMTHTDHAGVGTLSLVDATHRIASWRFTLTHNVTAMRLQEKFAERLEVLTHGKSLAASAQARCPQCKLQLENVGDECPVCSREQHAPLSTWGLFRLWRFAKPYQWRLLAGFLLTLASTAATLVPPYLTMPLMDDVLIPFQNGKDIDRDLVYLYLGGLLGAALLAWGLGWLKTYILALVSERIGADLRTTAYEHLMRLSLEYFGGRRTGDLMNRIGAETDRICVFLSLHLLDFATDVLMILMTASILISIEAGCSHLVAFAVHRVADSHGARQAAHGF
jgi:ATP-binding cassette, subfamily B, bacterial